MRYENSESAHPVPARLMPEGLSQFDYFSAIRRA
jgi:hypothetical protein